jgi:dihydroneopterin aldolase
VEIVRARLPESAARPCAPSRPPARACAARPSSSTSAPLAGGPEADAWLDAFAGSAPVPPRSSSPPAAPQQPRDSEGALRVGLLSIEAAAWALADHDPRLTVAATRAELDWALKTGRRPVWAPAKMLTDALPRPDLDASRPAALAAWLARELGAPGVDPRGRGPARPPADLALRRASVPADLAS